MPGRCRSRRGSTCCPPASARRSASRSSARTWTRWSASPRRSRPSSRQVPGTTQRLRRTHHRRVLPQHRARSRGARALRAGDRRPAGRRSRTALGGEMVTTTVEGRERFGVTVRYPRELRSDPQQIAQFRSGSHDGRGDDSARAVGQGRSRQGFAGHPNRERLAVRLHLHRHPRPRHRLVRGRGPQGGFRQREVSPGLLHRLERPVRIHGARRREAERSSFP